MLEGKLPKFQVGRPVRCVDLSVISTRWFNQPPWPASKRLSWRSLTTFPKGHLKTIPKRSQRIARVWFISLVFFLMFDYLLFSSRSIVFPKIGTWTYQRVSRTINQGYPWKDTHPWQVLHWLECSQIRDLHFVTFCSETPCLGSRVYRRCLQPAFVV